MLTKLLPDQVSKFWDVIKYAIEESLPPIVGESPNKMNNILTSILVNKTNCWVSYHKKGENKVFEGVVLTRILYDDASETRNLLIYCIYGYENSKVSSWTDALTALLKYSKKKRCAQIVAYTDNEKLLKMVSHLNGISRYSFISFDVDKLLKQFNQLG